jgi:uncharacterized protein
MSGAIAIFVKTPGLSPVKTRLQRVRGAAFAEHWHRLAALATASVVADAARRGGLHAYWAVAESAALDHPLWVGLPRVLQGEGDLGERMARVHDLLVTRHGFGILLGADAPQLQADCVLQAATWLRDDTPRCATAFAEDGGFWLHGGNRSVPLAEWAGVAYGRPDTGCAFHRVMARHGECLELPALRDVDEDEDLLPVRDALRALAAPTAAQLELLCWLDTVLPEATMSPCARVAAGSVAEGFVGGRSGGDGSAS